MQRANRSITGHRTAKVCADKENTLQTHLLERRMGRGMEWRGGSATSSVGESGGTEDLDEPGNCHEEVGNEGDCRCCLGTVDLGEGDGIGAGASRGHVRCRGGEAACDGFVDGRGNSANLLRRFKTKVKQR